MKKVSFIIPAFNAEKTISQCLQSILGQSYDPEKIEIILVDNNSTDQTSEFAKSFSRVRYVLEEKQGRSHARNTGLALANGEFVAFIDSDVFLDKDWLTNILGAFKADSVGGAQGPVIPANIMGKRSLNHYRKRVVSENTDGKFNLLYHPFKESPMINTAACVYRKEAVLQVGGFDIQLRRHEDIDLSRRVLLSGYDLAAVPDAEAHVIFNGEGWPSYFIRSFQDGFTKSIYLAKWKNQLFQSDLTGQSNASMFYDEVIKNFFRSFYFKDSYYLLKSLNALLKSLGRIFSLFSSAKKGFPSSVKTRERGYIFENGSPVIEFNFKDMTVKRIGTNR